MPVCCNSSIGTRTSRPPEGTSALGSTSPPSSVAAADDDSRAAAVETQAMMWVIIHNKWDEGNPRTEHIQDAEHLRPLREYLAMHCNKHPTQKKLKKKPPQNMAPERNDDPPQKQNERQGQRKKKGSRVPVSQARTHAHVNCMKKMQNAPMPASAISSQSSARPSRRRRKSALARCSASTASNSFFLSASRARRAALGGGGAGWEPGAWEARVDEVTDGRMGIGDCLSTGAVQGGYSTWEVVSRYRLVVAPTVWKQVTLRTAAALAAVSQLWVQRKCCL
jgi:hypothetical protein